MSIRVLRIRVGGGETVTELPEPAGYATIGIVALVGEAAVQLMAVNLEVGVRRLVRLRRRRGRRRRRAHLDLGRGLVGCSIIVRDCERGGVASGSRIPVTRLGLIGAGSIAELPAPRRHAAVAVGAAIGELAIEILALPAEACVGCSILVACSGTTGGRRRAEGGSRRSPGIYHDSSFTGLHAYLVAQHD